MEAMIQTEIKSSYKEGETNRGTGRKDWAYEGLGKGDPSCQMAEPVEGTSRKEEGDWGWGGEVTERRGSGERLERKGKLLVRRAGVGAVTCLLATIEGKQR